MVLVAVGRRPNTDKLGLAGNRRRRSTHRGFVRVNPHTYETTVPGVYAIGDVIGGLMLAHKAEEEGVACVELMAGKPGHVNYKACPNVVYTHPELAQVGMTEDDARKDRGDIRVGKFQFMANGRAVAMGEGEGLIKIIGDAKTDRLLGVHVLGAARLRPDRRSGRGDGVRVERGGLGAQLPRASDASGGDEGSGAGGGETRDPHVI